MPPFPKPRFAYEYDLGRELAALRAYTKQKPDRKIPRKAADRLLLATWNIANLGVQDRLDTDYALIAEMVGWFDLAAIQEVNDDLRGIEAIHAKLPARYDLLFSDSSGNQERQAFLYDTRKVTRLKEVGRLSLPPSDLASIKIPGATTPFPGFDRGPYLGSFACGSFRFALLNVHLFYGSPDPADVDRRTLETFAVAWWADRKHRDTRSYVPEIVPLGDFNLPKAEPGDPIYKALVSAASTSRRTVRRSARRSPPTPTTTRSPSSPARPTTASRGRAMSSTSTALSSRTCGSSVPARRS